MCWLIFTNRSSCSIIIKWHKFSLLIKLRTSSRRKSPRTTNRCCFYLKLTLINYYDDDYWLHKVIGNSSKLGNHRATVCFLYASDKCFPNIKDTCLHGDVNWWRLSRKSQQLSHNLTNLWRYLWSPLKKIFEPILLFSLEFKRFGFIIQENMKSDIGNTLILFPNEIETLIQVVSSKPSKS